MDPISPFLAQPDDPTQQALPTYLTAADNHNLGNVGSSWFDYSPGNIPKFATVSILSGLNSFYNTGVKVGNFLGGDFQENKTDAWISDIDSDLGQYYKQNKSAADVAGFMLTSLIPGMAGVKILNAGQKALAAADAGYVGGNLGMALGLRTPQIETYIAGAAKDIVTGQAAFTSITSNTVKALATGVWQNVLEGAAFETAVQATMQASPVLDGQSKSDVLWNIGTGGLFGGALGGAFTAAKTFGGIKSAVKELSAKILPFGSRGLYTETGNAADRLLFLADDFEHGPTLNPGDPNYAEQLKALQQRQTRISLDMRSAAHELVGGRDVTLGNMIADANIGQSSDDILKSWMDTDQVTRLNSATKVEAKINELAKAQQVDPNLQVSYYKLTGENAGDIINSKPLVNNLADTVSEVNKSTRDGVLDLVKDYGFSKNKYWDARNMSVATNSGHMEAEARYIWADHLAKDVEEGDHIGVYDLPLLTKALNQGQRNISLVDANGVVYKEGFGSLQELKNYIVVAKQEVASQLQQAALQGKNSALSQGATLKDAGDWLNQKIGKIVDSKVSSLEGTGGDAIDTGTFARSTAQGEYLQYLASKGLKPVEGLETNPDFLPSWAKVTKVIRDKSDVNGNVIDGMTWLKTQQTIAKQAVTNVVARQLPDYFQQLPEVLDRDLGRTNALGTGAGLLRFNNPEYDSLGSKMSLVGSVVQRAVQDAKDEFSGIVEGPLAALARNQDAVIEWNTINQKVAASPLQWARYAEGETKYLVPQKYLDAIQEGNLDIADLADNEIIQLHNPEVQNLVDSHISHTDDMLAKLKERKVAFGDTDNGNIGTFQPIRPDPRKYPFIAFVKDPTVVGNGRTSMIYASSENELKQLTDKAKQLRPELDIYFRKDTTEFYKAYNLYDSGETLNEIGFDAELKKEGIASNFFTKTDPQTTLDDFVSYHNRLIDKDVRDIVSAKYSDAFDWLKDQADAFSRVSTSRFGGSAKQLENEATNPFMSYIKTGLNLSRVSESGIWYRMNQVADTAVSKLVGTINEIWGNTGGAISQDQLDSINSAMQKYGMKPAYYDAATQLLVNAQPQVGYLSKFVRNANSVLSRLTLALDPLNAVVNALGANILRSTELKQLTDAVEAGDSEIAGKLADLYKIDVTGAGDYIRSPAKLAAKAMGDFFQDWREGNGEILQRYKDMGLAKTPLEQFRAMVDDLTIKGTESQVELSDRLKSAIAKVNQLSQAGEKYTGNKLAEEFNRFVSARSIELLTQPAVDKGIMTSAEQAAYMNTFVNRVEGNIIASQRPLMFQGPIGQAIGLFQSYQFNLMQQMFRYVSEGTAKDAAMLLGLQGTFFGLQGLPAFQAINQHIIGNASGNTDHKDLYDATYGIAGKNLGDLLTYGLPSKLTGINIYSRGDINPRQVTVIPNSLDQVPIVGATMKFFGALKDTAVRIGGGANVWESILQGIEHNGISRPLAGLAQTLQATTGNGIPYSTTSKGSIMFSNDLFSLATLSRLAGGRPLDEAIVNDGVYRISGYQQYDLARMQNLAEAIKTSSIQGQEVSPEQWQKFAAQYAANGGNQLQFNKFMMREIKAANTSGADKIVMQLQSPFAQKVQLLMGEAPTTQQTY